MAAQAKKPTVKQATKKKTALKATRTVAKRGVPKVRAGAKPNAAAAKAKRAQSSSVQPSKLATGIMRTLHNEHRYITTLQDSLESQIKQLAPGGKPDYHIICAMLDYISYYPDKFHHPLEDHIYERLVKRHRASIGDVEELLSQHQDMARDTQCLLKRVKAICAGKEKPMRNQLRVDLQNYVEFYRAHIDLEEGVVFPAAEKYLQESDWQAVNKSLHVVEDPVFSESKVTKYSRLRDYIDNKTEEVTAEFALAELFSIEAIIESMQASADGLVELREVCNRHARDSVEQNLETVKNSFKDKSSSAFALPGKLISGNIRDAIGTLCDIAKVFSATRVGATDPFVVRARYFKNLLKKNKNTKA